MVLLCINMLCQYFSVTVNVFHKHIKWDVISSSSLRLLLKVSIWHRCQNRNYNHHDGKKKFFFFLKIHIKRQSKNKDVLVIFILLLYNPLYYCKKRRTPICLMKTVLKRNFKRTLFHNSTWRYWLWWIVIEKVNYKQQYFFYI